MAELYLLTTFEKVMPEVTSTSDRKSKI